MSKRHQKFSQSERLEIVKESYEANDTVAQVALKYGIHASSLHRWRTNFRDEHLPIGSSATELDVDSVDLEQQNALLKKQLRQAELERDILKKAISIFSKADGKSSNL